MGAIKKGFFFYPLLQDKLQTGGSPSGSRYALFGLPDIGLAAAPILFATIVLLPLARPRLGQVAAPRPFSARVRWWRHMTSTSDS